MQRSWRLLRAAPAPLPPFWFYLDFMLYGKQVLHLSKSKPHLLGALTETGLVLRAGSWSAMPISGNASASVPLPFVSLWPSKAAIL